MNPFVSSSLGATILLMASCVVAQNTTEETASLEDPEEFARVLDVGPPPPNLELAQVSFDEGIMKRLINRWPEDLVIAPVPGRSPTFGWTLAVGGGYFMESGDPDSDSPPSAVGGFAWFAGSVGF